MKKIKGINLLLLGHASFWALVFLLNVGPHWETYLSTVELIQAVGLITLLQMFVAFITIKLLIPLILNKGKKLLFFVLLLAVLFLAAEINIAVRYLYLEPTFPQSYESFLKLFGHMTFRQRMISLWTFKYIFFTKIPLFTFPAVILASHKFYKKQQDVLKLSEQKRKAELSALKNQLNPHFIFNTLNNLYALALKKSDQTPLVIEKLSDILDYILYRCEAKYVSLLNEIKLIENYIGLEKIRYGQRLSIGFHYNVSKDVLIAPLILLTILENACKHSTSEELNKAIIDIELKLLDNEIYFQIKNTKPSHQQQLKSSENKIGLDNMKKQLNLLYPNSYHLDINETKQQYTLELRLKAK